MRKLSIIGVDISDSSIKVLQLDAESNITAFGTAPLQSDIVQDGRIMNKEAFSLTIQEVLKHTSPEVLFTDDSLLRTVVSLPESKIFTHTLVIPEEVKQADIHTYVYDDAKKIIPFDLDLMYWDFRIIEKNGIRHATFVGAPKINLDSYVEALTYANVKPTLIVGELFSLASVLLPQMPLQENYMIIDIGANNANIGVFTTDVIADSSLTVPFGGDHITEALALKLEIAKEEAELVKRKTNLQESKEDTDTTASTILKESLSGIVEAVKETCAYLETKNNQSIQHIILAGGTALLPGLAEYFSKTIGIGTLVANPLAQIKNRGILDKGTHEIFFANVVGLALQSKHIQGVGINLLTQYRYADDQTQKQKLAIKDIRSFGDLKYVLFTYFDTVRNYGERILAMLANSIRMKRKLILCIVFLLGALLFLGWVVIKYTHVIS